MLGRIVKFRRGDKYEEMPGLDTLSGPAAGGSAAEPPVPAASLSQQQTSNLDYGGLVHRQHHAEPDEPSSSASTPKIDFTPEDVFTVDRAIEHIGFGWFQIKLSFFTGLVWMADAMEMMILSILSPALHCEWSLPSWQQALLTTIVFSGMMLSSGFWGKICDKYGRKVELILCSAFTCYYGFLSAFAPNYIWILILRGLVGFGIGGVPQSITLYAEFLPSSTRARCIVLIEVFWAIGTCFIVFISIFVMPTIGWRYLLGIASVPLMVFFLACFWLPESPRFDIARGMPERAMATLERIARDNGKPMPLGKLIDVFNEGDKPVVRGQIRDLLAPEMRLTTCLLWFIWLANAFSYYGVVLMTTELFAVGDECHGGSAENAAASAAEPPCRLECKQLSVKDYTDLLWTTFAEFPGLFITIGLLEWIGRRRTIALEFFIFSFFVFLVNICITRSVLTAFLFIARAFISGGFQATYVYTPEVYPTTMRALGLGMCSAMARVGAIVTPFVAQVLLRKSVYLAVSSYASICIVAAIMSMLLPIETKGREMKDTHSSTNSGPPSRSSTILSPSR